MNLYLATTNPGKLRDFRATADHFNGVRIEPLTGLDAIVPPEETGETFEANARLKAAYYSRFAPGLWVLADDSGLEVDALGGLPGVRSARFAGDHAWPPSGDLDSDNNGALQVELYGLETRTARYRCALALACDGDVDLVAFGKLEGNILDGPVGSGGFGYDPLFFAHELHCTMAEATMEDRLRVSHRGRALRSLLQQWRPC